MQSLRPILLALATAACSSVGHDDRGRVETLSIELGATDLPTLSARMVDALIASPSLQGMSSAGAGDDQRIVVLLGDVRNHTSETVDVAAISEGIRTSLLRSGKFRLVPATTVADADVVLSGALRPSDAADADLRFELRCAQAYTNELVWEAAVELSTTGRAGLFRRP